ncbi:hypothetical protein EJ06DRAFT_121964 [Trichodelitschia bisporula]|uniref:non-specific serine/threonine protein kinase n=1 Tax=Trichodelitschia bisporula TaxID=703511 RepID=A0A6G1HQQ4_9PEZI|nr:hypothetical protein EJ06DRAFT_121964 [Trichodelitschia bisporula]
MVRKHVYGKRRAAVPSFAMSDVFSRSSPLKPPPSAVNDAVDAATKELEHLALSGDHKNDEENQTQKSPPKPRPALTTKNTNVPPPSAPVRKKSAPARKAKTKAADEPLLDSTAPTHKPEPQPADETLLESITVLPRRPRTAPTPKPLTAPPLDPYLAPLLTLAALPSPTAFDTWTTTLATHFSIAKIAEGSYSEVYRLTPHNGGECSVLKLLALRPDPTIKGKRKSPARLAREAAMSTPAAVATETRLLQRLAPIPGFSDFRALHVLRGPPGGAFVEAWRSWNKARPAADKSGFADPGRKGVYDEAQVWAVIEMQDAGVDVESLTERGWWSVWAVWDVFWQVALAVAKGEGEARFEHRDLHLGNICVKSARGGTLERPVVKGVGGRLGFTGLEVTVIDYTLSRAEMPLPPGASGDGEESAEVAYFDLETEEAIFEGDGDVEYQYDIYRYMRSAMYFSDPLARFDAKKAEGTGRKWLGFHPQTNLVWLHFVLRQLLANFPAWSQEDEEAKMAKVGVLGEKEDVVMARQKMVALEAALRQMEAMLDVSSMPREGLACVRDLVAIALEEEWLGEEDVVGC